MYVWITQWNDCKLIFWYYEKLLDMEIIVDDNKLNVFNKWTDGIEQKKSKKKEKDFIWIWNYSNHKKVIQLAMIKRQEQCNIQKEFEKKACAFMKILSIQCHGLCFLNEK